jgi:hypothetical protein
VLSGDTGGSAGDVTRVGVFARGTESDYKKVQLKSSTGNKMPDAPAVRPLNLCRSSTLVGVPSEFHTFPGFVILTSAYMIMDSEISRCLRSISVSPNFAP